MCAPAQLGSLPSARSTCPVRKELSRMPAPITPEQTVTERKLQPKLRMVRNGGTTVNLVRSEYASSVAASSPRVFKEVPALRSEQVPGVQKRDIGPVTWEKPAELSDEVLVS